jgi:prolipoprotein diacylglyceryltransferase
MSFRFGYKFSFFLNNILWYFLSIFIFSRLLYVIWDWNNMKYIENPFEFFIMSDYNFSLFWAIIWFFIIFLLTLKIEKSNMIKYIDWIVLSFLFILFIGYIWAFFWWQVYGNETHFWIEIWYSHPFSNIPYEVDIFPLAIVYSIIFFILFSALYTLSILTQIRWLIWYVWLIAFSIILFIFEFFNWRHDIFKIMININLTQICSVILIVFASYWLYRVSIDKSVNKKINIS